MTPKQVEFATKLAELFRDYDASITSERESSLVRVRVAGVLVTHRGYVYRYARVEQSISKNRIQIGPGSYSAFSILEELEQAIMMAMHLTKLDIKKALALVAKNLLIRPDSYVTLPIKDIASELVRRGFTQDPVLIQPIGNKPLEKNK